MRFLAVLLTLFLSLGCASKLACVDCVPEVPVTPEIDTSGVLTLISETGFAHACPCDGTVLTAGHVAGENYYTKGTLWTAWSYYSWQDQLGFKGLMHGATRSLFTDFGTMKVYQGEIDRWYTRATVAPQTGDSIHWVQFEEETYNSITKHGTLEYVVTNYAWFSPGPEQGSSGSCVFNDQGEVIGVVVWGSQMSGELQGVFILVVP